MLLLLVFIYFFNPEVYIWGISELRIVYILNIVLIGVVFKNYKKIEVFGDKYSILITLLLASIYLSALLAEVDKTVGLAYANLFLKLWLFWLLLKNILKIRIENIELFYWGSLFSVTSLAIWGVQQYSLGNIRLEGFGGGQIVGSNQLASAFVWAAPIAYFKILSEKKKKRKIAALICLISIIAGIVCTQSRQAFLAIIFCIFLYLIKSRHKLRLIAILLILGFISLPFIPRDYFERMETIGSYEEDQSATGRLDMWKAAFRVFNDFQILGVGGRNFYIIAPNYAKEGEIVRVTHNTFLQILTEEGILGIALFLSLMFITLINSENLSRRFSDSFDNKKIYYLAMTSKFSLLAVLICCIFQNKAEHEFLYWSSAVVAALTKFAQEEKIENNNTASS